MAEEGANPLFDVNSLPTLPAVAMEAIRLMEDEEADFNSIGQLLKNDQVLTGRLLHYANAAQMGRRPAASVNQAVCVLGLNGVRGILLSASIFDCFSDQFRERRQGLLNFWLHSVGVAVTAERLARRLGFPDPDLAYIAGLLHDLGKLVCHLQAPEKFEQIWRELERQGSYSTRGFLPLDIERNILDTDHIEVGKLLARAWGLPQSLARVMWQHHQPVFETILPDNENLAQLIRFADLLCITHNVGSSYFLPAGTYCHQHFHFALEAMMLQHHLSAEEIDALMDGVFTKTEEVGRTLGFWDEAEYRRLFSAANRSLGTLSLRLHQENQLLDETNRVLKAASTMNRRLSPGLPLSEAAGVIIAACHRAFGKRRAFCVVHDPNEPLMVGRLFDGGTAHPLRIPTTPTELKQYGRQRKAGVMEAQALKRLARRLLDAEPDRESTGTSGLVDIVADSQFLATFFLPNRHSHLDNFPVLGQLLLDFSDTPLVGENGIESLSRNFETLARTAANGVERLLLEADLTRQAQALARSSRRMEESQRLLFHSHRLATVGRLAAGAAHEINNPLTIISLNIQILERLLTKHPDPAISERLQVIAGQGERISKIVQDLMSFARPTQPKFAAAAVSEIMARVLAVIGDRVSMTKIKVHNLLTDELPTVMVDPLQIEQVFMNLLINANHAMPGGGEITLAGRAVSGMVEVEITDTGHGISHKNLNKIFDPFFTTKKEGEGTGLGLAVCNSIVEHNGGAMRVASREGEGTAFTVSLPRDTASRLRDMQKDLEQKAPPVAPIPDKSRILVVDDEGAINEMLRDSLRMEGYEAEGAYDGEEAIRRLKEKSYQLVILDIRMPRKDGLEVLAFIKEQYPDVKVLIITALATKEEIKNTVKLGAYACLKKPFRLETVLETVRRGLSGGGRSDQ